MANPSNRLSFTGYLVRYALVAAVAFAPIAAFAGDPAVTVCLDAQTACPEIPLVEQKSVDSCCAEPPATDVSGEPADGETDPSDCGDCPCCIALTQTVPLVVNTPSAHPALSLVEVVQPIASLRPLTLADDIHLRPPIA